MFNLFNRHILIDYLPVPIRDFINKYKIELVNPKGNHGDGVDGVFGWLEVGYDSGIYLTAILNLMKDNRFTPEMRNELGNIIYTLTNGAKDIMKEDYSQQAELNRPDKRC